AQQQMRRRRGLPGCRAARRRCARPSTTLSSGATCHWLAPTVEMVLAALGGEPYATAWAVGHAITLDQLCLVTSPRGPTVGVVSKLCCRPRGHRRAESSIHGCGLARCSYSSVIVCGTRPRAW